MKLGKLAIGAVVAAVIMYFADWLWYTKCMVDYYTPMPNARPEPLMMPVDPNTLGDYLGGKGHLVIISVKDKDYLHVHPSVENGNFVFHTTFSKPGIYRGWLQFQTENIIHTADFVFKVEQATQSMDESEDKMHTDQH